MNNFYQCLEKWEESVKKCTGFSKTEMGMMLLSVETQLGLNHLRTVVAYMRQGNKYLTVRKQIIITSPAFTL